MTRGPESLAILDTVQCHSLLLPAYRDPGGLLVRSHTLHLNLAGTRAGHGAGGLSGLLGLDFLALLTPYPVTGHCTGGSWRNMGGHFGILGRTVLVSLYAII